MDSLIVEILIFIQENLSTELTVEGVAKHFNYSKFYFSRNFKRITGFSAADYISALKIDRSLDVLLQESKVITTQVEADYASSSSFSAIFKKQTGLSPKEYQDNMESLIVRSKELENLSELEFDYYNPSNNGVSANSCTVNLYSKTDSVISIAYVGLFQTPIPSHAPIVGKALFGK